MRSGLPIEAMIYHFWNFTKLRLMPIFCKRPSLSHSKLLRVAKTTVLCKVSGVKLFLEKYIKRTPYYFRISMLIV
jgi:hypothetical protein